MNLVVNGDAETGPGGTAEPVTTVHGWRLTQGAPALVPYDLGGGYPTPDDPGPTTRGTRFYTGGNSARTALLQDIDLPRGGPTGRKAVDAGRVRYTLTAWLGGYADQQDGARLSAELHDAHGTPLALSVLGPVTAEERAGRTALLERTATAPVPPGTRTARLLLTFTRAGGTANDGYADAVTLTLNAVRPGGRP
ncbi:phosphoesterase [Streptomyces sp. WMMC500]|uniref:phosphoesterase n=1 Tax=Streptomyces sp. WMMC500 TaxID=3015154 RepID=UPI00248C66CC|nr:phosphoesterase [Streptomyces sp. WMMC500]WBB62330.1 phosphoesterase [Streptomyces sp. WMMC500]